MSPAKDYKLFVYCSIVKQKNIYMMLLRIASK